MFRYDCGVHHTEKIQMNRWAERKQVVVNQAEYSKGISPPCESKQFGSKLFHIVLLQSATFFYFFRKHHQVLKTPVMEKSKGLV